MGKKGDLSDFEHGIVVVAGQAGLSASSTGIFTHNHLKGLQRNCLE